MSTLPDAEDYVDDLVTLLQNNLSADTYTILDSAVIEESVEKACVVGISWVGVRPTSPPDGWLEEIGRPHRVYTFYCVIMVATRQTQDATQRYLGRRLIEIQNVLEDDAGAPPLEDCDIYFIEADSEKLDFNTGEIELRIYAADDG